MKYYALVILALDLLNSIPKNKRKFKTLFGGVFGYSFGGAIGVLAGLVGGFMVATLVCGILAVFLDIRDELVLANNLSLELLNELKKEQK